MTTIRKNLVEGAALFQLVLYLFLAFPACARMTAIEGWRKLHAEA